MAQFLFVVEVPANKAQSPPAGYPYEWTKFADEASNIPMLAKTCVRHQQNAWLIPVENGMPLLLALSNLAVKHELAYSVLLLTTDGIQMTATAKKA